VLLVARHGFCPRRTNIFVDIRPILDLIRIKILLDCIYQLITARFIYPLELLFTATLLAFVPYVVLRGPFNRVARLLLTLRSAADRKKPQR